jgi:glycerophosphoryl diester phosphodiesterase
MRGPDILPNRLSPKIEALAHRGASALRPEHTIASYVLAIHQGADYIEPDLVCTKDGVLVARHENNLIETTDVSSRPDFQNKKTRKTIDGVTEDGWFVEDFTLEELKTLRAIERLPEIRVGNTAFNGAFQIPTLAELIEVIAAESSVIGRKIGIVPEIKHSSYHASIGLPMEKRLVQTLEAHSYTQHAPIEIQSFEVTNLKLLRELMGQRPNLRLMQLVGTPDMRPGDVMAQGQATIYGDMLTLEGMRKIATYADVVAPSNRMVIPLGPDQKLTAPTSLVSIAHDAGLLVHTWTFRPENQFLAADFRSAGPLSERHDAGSMAEIQTYLATGIDGFFSDDSAISLQAIQAFMES